MAAATQVPGYVPILNRLILGLLRAGLPVGPMRLLTVRGRSSGRPRTTPVGLFEHGGHRWLLATFGETNWTLNLRAAGEGTLSRGGYSEPIAAIALSPEAGGPVLSEVLGPRLRSPLQAAFLRRFYALSADSSMTDYVREAERHPVFELRRKPNGN
jgi:deazaflavin-dependent oxidoreductase (nitroreductase family)